MSVTQENNSYNEKHESSFDYCPCCDEFTDLDQHHWSYKPEVTVRLCRDCHDYVHAGQYVEEQGENWQQQCLERLAMLDAVNNPGQGRIRERFNVPETIQL